MLPAIKANPRYLEEDSEVEWENESDEDEWDSEEEEYYEKFKKAEKKALKALAQMKDSDATKGEEWAFKRWDKKKWKERMLAKDGSHIQIQDAYPERPALEHVWLATAWTTPWTHTPGEAKVHLDLADASLASVTAPTAKSIGLPELESLPTEILQSIRSYSSDHLFWRYSYIRAKAEEMSRVDKSTSNYDNTSCKLDTINSWHRGEKIETNENGIESGIASVFEDASTGYFRGILLEYEDGTQRACRQCKIGIDPIKEYFRPAFVCKHEIPKGKNPFDVTNYELKFNMGEHKHGHGRASKRWQCSDARTMSITVRFDDRVSIPWIDFSEPGEEASEEYDSDEDEFDFRPL
ncbi:uncharacterized protein FIESC28_04171 [Fusarium coffeatum]|uniref:Uncharacterized protein n=1 Tax=Fusarium coffeatum TaxID=231269 RepID=A0A366S1Z5_9HYPO|nr:uncharacterized protein FIESC28_04171 [Fusarium coffeatum]RBR23032.1 hypothetical protein FIESC28_04171 [Fusarium coffeatum]